MQLLKINTCIIRLIYMFNICGLRKNKDKYKIIKLIRKKELEGRFAANNLSFTMTKNSKENISVKKSFTNTIIM